MDRDLLVADLAEDVDRLSDRSIQGEAELVSCELRQ